MYGLKLRLIDTPGLLAASDAQAHNTKVLKKINNARKKYKPDLVMYAERMDMVGLLKSCNPSRSFLFTPRKLSIKKTAVAKL